MKQRQMTYSGRVPGHVAIIMDGNGRWAESQGLPRLEGHRRGAKSVREVTRACRRLGVRALTLYAFSEQNWFRPSSEVDALMTLLGQYIRGERREILDNDIRLSAIGRVRKLPDAVRRPLESLMAESENNQGMDLCLALSYGGREEIVDAVRSLVTAARLGKVQEGQVDESLIAEHLWTSHLPAVDLIIRTSGELRLSNFLLWHAAYAELYFTDTLWPNFGETQLIEAFREFSRRNRRFGRVGETVPPPDAEVL